MKKWMDLYIICFGLLSIIFKRQIVRLIKKSQVKVKLSREQEEMANSFLEKAIMIGGAIFTIIGILTYFGILKTRQ